MNQGMIKRAWALGFADATNGNGNQNPYEDESLSIEYEFGFLAGQHLEEMA